MTDEEIRELRVEAGEAGRRLDHLLAAKLGLSHAAARRLLASGRVRRGGRPVGLAHKGEGLSAGERLTVAGPSGAADARVLPQPGAPLRVLAEGSGWIAVDKPPGAPVHPLRGGETGTVLNALIARRPEIHGVGDGGLRSGVVHRLDVDTSGALLFATTEESWRHLRSHFAGHRVEKVYRAIVRGSLERAGSVELVLRVARARPARVAVVDPAGVGPAGAAGATVPPSIRTSTGRPHPGARRCGTSWRPLVALEGATLVEARPVTGFLHQVRVTFAHLGHPLAGDRLYGPTGDATGAARHMLHAARLAWDGEAVESPDPADFVALLARLRRQR